MQPPTGKPGPSTTIAQAKAALRTSVLATRNALAPETRASAALRIVEQIVALPAFERARVVMAYCSFGSELDTSSFIDEIHARRKTLVLPRIDRARDALAMHIVRDPGRDLAANAWGIREPQPDVCMPARPSEVDFILVPGIAFDARGGRLGYGKAYYDRLFHALAREGAVPFTVAGAFDAQIVDRVPMDVHDVAVPRIVTEARVIDA
ncbi:MAG TPA: 5-formyltetrahydrofolate cyclo-ligase [Casimicrobiaceae bacterium]